MAAKADLRYFVREEAEVGAHLSEKLDVAAAVFAKGEALAEVNLFRMEPVVHDRVEKIFGMLSSKLPVKADHDRLLYSQELEICKALVERLEQWRCRFRVKYRTRMRIKRYRGCDRLDGSCTLGDSMHYLLMAKVQAVKNAEGQNSGFLDVGIFGAVKDLHEQRAETTGPRDACPVSNSFAHNPWPPYRVG
jgi:hypothetical protein